MVGKSMVAMSPNASRVVVYGLEFQAALKAALAIGGSSKPFDVIQISAALDSENIAVCARDGANKIMIAVAVGAEAIELGDKNDRIFEITRADARALSSMRMTKADSEDDEYPLIGLILTDTSVTRTDETGLGLGIRQARVRRVSAPGHRLALGDVDAMVQSACVDMGNPPVDAVSEMTPVQVRRISQAAVTLGKNVVVHPMGASGDLKNRVIVDLGPAIVFAAVENPKDKESDNAVNSESGDHRQLSIAPASPLDAV